jgi:hypothetical protein
MDEVHFSVASKPGSRLCLKALCATFVVNVKAMSPGAVRMAASNPVENIVRNGSEILHATIAAP